MCNTPRAFNGEGSSSAEETPVDYLQRLLRITLEAILIIPSSMKGERMVKKLVGIYENKIRPRAKKILIGLLIFFVLFTITGFFGLPPLLKYILTKELSQNLHREVTINQITFNPYTLSTAVRGLLIKDRSSTETFVSCDELFLNLGSLSAIRMAPVLKEIRITRPYIKITRNQGPLL